MSMSTNISDLPDQDECQEVESYGNQNNHQESQQYHQQPQYQQYHRQHQQHQQDEDYGVYEEEPKITKKLSKIKENFDMPNFFQLIKREVNEENLLILVMLYLSTTSYSLDYTNRLMSFIPVKIPFNENIIKSILLLIIFILIKNYILPRIKI